MERLVFGNIVGKKKKETEWEEQILRKMCFFVSELLITTEEDFCKRELKSKHNLNFTKQSPSRDYAGWSKIHIQLHLAQIMFVHSTGNVFFF